MMGPDMTAKKNVLMAALSYVGPLVILSFLVAKDEPFAKFHIKQGLVLFSLEIIIWIVCSMLSYQLWMIYGILKLVTLILSIIGIVNAVQKKEKALPVIGKFSSHFKF